MYKIYINIYIIYSCCKTSVLKVVFDKKKEIWCILFVCLHLMFDGQVSLMLPSDSFEVFFHVFLYGLSQVRVDLHFWMREEKLVRVTIQQVLLVPQQHTCLNMVTLSFDV